MERKRLHKGIENFEDIITQNFYYMNKTVPTLPFIVRRKASAL